MAEDFNLLAIKREPTWEPNKTETIVAVVNQRFKLALKRCVKKPVPPENVTINDDVAAAFLGSNPIISSVGIINEPPPLPISPTSKPSIVPTVRLTIISFSCVKFFTLGLQPDSIKIAAKRVNKAKMNIIGLAERRKFNIAPIGALITIAMAKKSAIFTLTSPFARYVNAAELEVQTLSKSPNGIASLLKSRPSQ